MDEFTQEELSFIKQILAQLPWKAGNSDGVLKSESIIKKCDERLTEEKGE
jgi:hypothetical protein